MTSFVAAGALAKAWLIVLAMMAGQGTLLALCALALTRAGRLRPSWQAAIWLVVTVKLALPWSPALPWSLSDLLAGFSSHDAPAAITAGVVVARPAPQAWPAIGWLALAFVWLAGAALVLVQAARAYRRTLAAARRAPSAPADAQALLPANIRLVVGDDHVGPHVVRSIIVVPRSLVSDHALLRAALLHELAHIRRRDWLGRAIQVAARALFWWWPVARLVHRKLDLAREAACDAWALEAGDVPRPAYARLLVRMAALRAAGAPALATPHALDARVAAVLGPPARARMGLGYRLVLALWALIALGGARTASARGRAEACRYTPALAQALLVAHPEADLDGDGQLSRAEACDLQAALREVPDHGPRSEMDTELLSEPLCCNCGGAEVYSGPDTVSCQNVGDDR